MKKYLLTAIVLALMVAVTLPTVAPGIVFGKAHVPAGKVQVSHKDKTARNVAVSSLSDHVGHGDIQLPACDFANVFPKGSDTSNVVSADFTGVTYSDKPFQARVDANGITSACPSASGTF